MEIYGVKIIFQYLIENESRIIYEESVRLFHAESFDGAFDKAEKMAKDEEYEYMNVYAERVKYRFYKNAEAFRLFDKLEFEDGSEVFSTHFEMQDAGDDLIEKRYCSCSAEDMYIIRQAEFNGVWTEEK